MDQGGPPRRLRGGERADQWDIVQSDQGDAGANRGVPDHHSDANLQPREHAPAVQEEPLRQPLEVPHQHHQEEALDVLRSTRGSQWDAATEGCVAHPAPLGDRAPPWRGPHAVGRPPAGPVRPRH